MPAPACSSAMQRMGEIIFRKQLYSHPWILNMERFIHSYIQYLSKGVMMKLICSGMARIKSYGLAERVTFLFSHLHYMRKEQIIARQPSSENLLSHPRGSLATSLLVLEIILNAELGLRLFTDAPTAVAKRHSEYRVLLSIFEAYRFCDMTPRCRKLISECSHLRWTTSRGHQQHREPRKPI